MKPFCLSFVPTLLCASVSASLLAVVPAHADPPTLGAVVNGSTVTLTKDQAATVGGVGSGAQFPISIGNIIANPDGSVSEAGTLTVNGLVVPLSARVVSFVPSAFPEGGGTIQYAVDGGPVDLGTQGDIDVQPFGGTVSPAYASVRVPVAASLTWHSALLAPAPEPSSWAAFGLGALGLVALTVRRRVCA